MGWKDTLNLAKSKALEFAAEDESISNAINQVKTVAQEVAKDENVNKAISKVKEVAESEEVEILQNTAKDFKDRAVRTKNELDETRHELDILLDQVLGEYNTAYVSMNDKGIQLFMSRTRCSDTIDVVEQLVNSIANRPQEFDTTFEEIKHNREQFRTLGDFGKKELEKARKSANGAAAGLAAASMAPTALMWVATTFGTASTGAAISTLSGAAASNAALAWLGGGALAAGGHGIVAGKALLVVAGPVGQTVAMATLLYSIVLFSKNKRRSHEEKNKEIESVKKNTEEVQELEGEITALLLESEELRTGVNACYADCMKYFGKDYSTFSTEDKKTLGSLVNNVKTLSCALKKTIEANEEESEPNENDEPVSE